MSHPTIPTERRPQGLRSLLLRLVFLVLLVVVGFVVARYLDLHEPEGRARLLAILTDFRDSPWGAPVLVGLYLVVSPIAIPISPLIAIGGAVFGPLYGWFLNFVGAWSGAMVSFLIARYLARDLVVRFLGPERIAKIDRLLDKHGFWALVGIRFLPIPFVVANFGAAISGFSVGRFALASVVGLVPALAFYTYLGAAVVGAATGGGTEAVRNALLALVAALALTLFPVLRNLIRRRRSAVDPQEDRTREKSD